ncbi:hypothetical protein AB1J28_05780 [Lysinibacillus irui]|uniref:hypothetical protein n=1 Tax=Lysinibacillus irui TaxID=2998077 RepID=UPI003D27CC32
MKYDEKYNRFFKDESRLSSFNCLPTEHTTQQNNIKFLNMLFDKCLGLSNNEEYAHLAEEYFPIEQRELLYSDFNKGKTNIYSSFDLDMTKVMEQKSAIIQALKYFKANDLISSYSLEKTRFIIDAPRYVINLLITHYGDVLYYTFGKKSGMNTNYNNTGSVSATLNILDKYVG